VRRVQEEVELTEVYHGTPVSCFLRCQEQSAVETRGGSVYLFDCILLQELVHLEQQFLEQGMRRFVTEVRRCRSQSGEDILEG
jgi:hypothetical protein